MNDILTKDCAPPPIMSPSVLAPLSSSSTQQKFVKLDSAEGFQLQKSTALEDYERRFFAKFFEEEDDDPPVVEREDTIIGNSSVQQTSDCDDSDNDDGGVMFDKCQPCSSASSAAIHSTTASFTTSSSSSTRGGERRIKSTDNDLKSFAFDLSRMGMVSCNPSSCKLGGQCVQKTTIESMRHMVNYFWGNSEDPAPSSKTRHLLILNILKSAFRPDSEEFHFYATNYEKNNNRKVCEAAGFLILRGLSNNPNASAAPRQWTNLIKYVKSGKIAAGIPYSTKSERLLMKVESKSTKFKSATTFIEYFAKEFGDTIPGPQGIIQIPLLCQKL